MLALLGQLAGMPAPQPRRVIVTDNRRETALRAALRGRVYPFELVLVENQAQAGFGANHNRAFAKDQELGASELFAVVNPDLRLLGNPFPAMAFALGDLPNSGLSYPRQLDGQGRVQDAERRLPTPGRLWRRYLCPRQDEVPAGTAPDWVNAACLLLRHEAYARIQGFDERYHMYCEDVDLCLRMQLAGWRMVRADALVEHAGRRASRRNLRHMAWHVASLLRLWRSDAYRAFSRASHARESAP